MDKKGIGGIAALIEAATFIFGFATFATVLSYYTIGDLDRGGSGSFVVENQSTLYTWNLVILIMFGVALVPLVLALHERLRDGAPVLAQLLRTDSYPVGAPERELVGSRSA